MPTILITGASGFIGEALLEELNKTHEVITFGRKPTKCIGSKRHTHLQGSFTDDEDLRSLDSIKIDVAVHLAAVTGGCEERDGILVNLEGTRLLMRRLIKNGCRKFVNASSIAVCGFQSSEFRPLKLPITDNHPCLDRDGYGFSKYLMEELTNYFIRQNNSLDIINLRLAAIYPDEKPPEKVIAGDNYEWALGSITSLKRSEAVRAFSLAANAPFQPGVRTMNAVSKHSWVDEPVGLIIRSWWKTNDYDQFFQNNPNDISLFDSEKIEKELGFISST